MPAPSIDSSGPSGVLFVASTSRPSPSEESGNSRCLRGRLNKYRPVEEERCGGVARSSAVVRGTPCRDTFGPGSLSSVRWVRWHEEDEGEGSAMIGCEKEGSLLCETDNVLRNSVCSRLELNFLYTVSSEVGFSSLWRYLRYRRRFSNSLTSDIVTEIDVGCNRIISSLGLCD